MSGELSEKELAFKKRQDELFAVINFMLAENLKVHKGVIDKMSSIEYFRGVNFHVKSLEKRAEILALMPTFSKDSAKPFKLTDVADSIKLG